MAATLKEILDFHRHEVAEWTQYTELIRVCHLTAGKGKRKVASFYNLVEDLQLAAEFGSSLLEKNRALEAALRDHQAIIEEQSQQIEYLRRRVTALKNDCEAKSRQCDQLESSLQDLGLAHRRLSTDAAQDKVRLKSLQAAVEELELKCQDFQEEMESKGTSPGGASGHLTSPKEITVSMSRDDSFQDEEDEEEDEELAKLKATLSRTKCQLARAERERQELELELRVALEENASLQKEIEISANSEHLKKVVSCLSKDEFLETVEDFMDFEQDPDFSGEECSLVQLGNGIVAFGCQASLSSLGSSSLDSSSADSKDNSSLLTEINKYSPPKSKLQERDQGGSQVLRSWESPIVVSNGHNDDKETFSEREEAEYKKTFKELFDLLHNTCPMGQNDILSESSLCEDKSTNTDSDTLKDQPSSKTSIENLNSMTVKTPLLKPDIEINNDTEMQLLNSLKMSILKTLSETLWLDNFLRDFPVKCLGEWSRLDPAKKQMLPSFGNLTSQCCHTNECFKAVKSVATNTDEVLNREKKYKVVVRIKEPLSTTKTKGIAKDAPTSISESLYSQATDPSNIEFSPERKGTKNKSAFLEATNRYFEDTYEDIKVLVHKGVSTSGPEETVESPFQESPAVSDPPLKPLKDVYLPTSPSRVKQIIKMFQSKTLG